MNARRVNAAAGVICASQKQGRTLAAALAAALDAAGMLMSPEMAAELERLRNRVAELETVRDDVLTLHVKYVDSGHCQHDGELWPCPTAEAVGGAA